MKRRSIDLTDEDRQLEAAVRLGLVIVALTGLLTVLLLVRWP
jgi:hypothetical protein